MWLGKPCAEGKPLVRRVDDLGPGAFKLSRAAFVPPGYTSLLYAHLYENASCAFPTPLFKGFKDFVLQPLGLLQQTPLHFQGPLKVLRGLLHCTIPDSLHR